MPTPTRVYDRGTIKGVLFMIWCGRCGKDNAFEVSSKITAMDRARKQGWVKTHNDGWCCKGCLDDHERRRK